MELYKEATELIVSANKYYTKYTKDCDKIAKLAQKYIDWDESIGCEYFPADGICLTAIASKEFDSYYSLAECVCPASLFFRYIYENNLSKIEYKDFKTLCI